VGVLALLPGVPALAGPPTDRLREFFGSVDVVLADSSVAPLDKVARAKRLVTDIADVHGSASAAMGPAWEARTLAEREEFTSLFAELLERAYVGRLAGTVSASGGVTMRWLGETMDGDGATVTTGLRARDGRDVVIEYRMTQRRGRWLVRDVVLDGLSTIENYRAQVRHLLGRGSFADLVAIVRAKLSEDTLMFAHSDRAPTVLALAIEEPPPAPSAAEVMPAALPRVVTASRGAAAAPRVAAAASRVIASVAPLRAVAPLAPPRSLAAALQQAPSARVAPAPQRAVAAPPPLDVEVPMPTALLANGDGGVLPVVSVVSSPEPRAAAAVDLSGVDTGAVGPRALLLTFVASLAAAWLRRGGAPAR
jgi:phospholipid transport system substrate-binding protein